MDVVVTHKPNFEAQYRVLREELAQALVEGGRDVVLDNTQRIDLRVDHKGHGQRANSPAWARHKRKTKNHDVPLKYEEVLCDPYGYELNNEPAMGSVRPPVETLTVNCTVTKKGEPPRDKVVIWLRKLGYRYWGLSEASKKRIREKLKTALDKAVTRIKRGDAECPF